MRSLVTGATGFVGRHLVSKLDQPVLLGRDPKRIQKLFGDVEAHSWTPFSPVDSIIFQNIDTVFHLAGESVFQGRWNAEKKDRILRSRVDGTRNLVESLATLAKPPTTLICASAIGYYGSRGDKLLTELSLPGDDFLASVCVAWEKEASQAEKLGIRVVQVRTGVVLGAGGGALQQMLTPFRFGLGGKIGSGKQFMSWIHIDDLVGIMLYAAGNESVRGPVNAVAPASITNGEFTTNLASVLKRPAFFQVPGFALKAVLGEFGDVLLGSQRVVPKNITDAGYSFVYPELSDALRALIK